MCLLCTDISTFLLRIAKKVVSPFMMAEAGEGMPPQNEDPAFITNTIGIVVSFVQTYGWFLVLAAFLVLYFKDKFDSVLNGISQGREDAANKKVDRDTAMRQHEGLERARARMQEQLTMQAGEYAEKQKEKEEKKREEKIAEMEALLQGKSRQKKPLPPSPQPTQTTSSTQKAKKTSLRPEYNPLMGDTSGGGMCFRSPRRGGGG